MNYETEAQDYLATRKTSTSTVAELTEFAEEMVKREVKRERIRIADSLARLPGGTLNSFPILHQRLSVFAARLCNEGGE